MRVILGLLVTVALIAVPYGLWYAQSEGIFESSLDTSMGMSERTQVWGDEWVQFLQEPQVCRGVLTAKGRARNGASISYEATRSLPFVLYRKSELAPQLGFAASTVTVPPIAGFLKPLDGSSYYPSLEQTDIVATVLQTPTGGVFELVADWPTLLPDPGEVAFGVWGYRPDYGQDSIRLIRVSEC